MYCKVLCLKTNVLLDGQDFRSKFRTWLKTTVCEERKARLEPLKPIQNLIILDMDLFEWKSAQHLLEVNYFSRFIETTHLYH